MTAHDTLAKPPLIEALVEFRFDPKTPWNWTIPGQVFDQVKQDYPKIDEVSAVEWNLPNGKPAGLLPSQGSEVRIAPERVQLKREDERSMIQIGQNLLAVNQLAPYPGWDQFRKAVASALQAYVKVTESCSLARIGLRYINRIELPEGSIEIADYLRSMPALSGTLDRRFSGFRHRLDLMFEEQASQLNHQVHVSDGCLIVDLDFWSSSALCNKLPETAEAVDIWLEEAHENVYNAFRDTMTEMLFHSFQE